MRQRGITPRGRARHAQRLTAPERRQALLEAATQVFAEGSYSGATTAEIARAAGVSEPILYRHFANKRGLYLAVIEAAWHGLRQELEERREKLGPAGLVQAVGDTLRAVQAQKAILQTLWVQALTEAGEDPQIRKYMRRHLREVHDYVRDIFVEAQAAGGIQEDRDAEAEAWIFIAGALLLAVGGRLGGLLSADDFARIRASRARWLTGT